MHLQLHTDYICLEYYVICLSECASYNVLMRQMVICLCCMSHSHECKSQFLFCSIADVKKMPRILGIILRLLSDDNLKIIITIDVTFFFLYFTFMEGTSVVLWKASQHRKVFKSVITLDILSPTKILPSVFQEKKSLQSSNLQDIWHIVVLGYSLGSVQWNEIAQNSYRSSTVIEFKFPHIKVVVRFIINAILHYIT